MLRRDNTQKGKKVLLAACYSAKSSNPGFIQNSETVTTIKYVIQCENVRTAWTDTSQKKNKTNEEF